jgi:hypothetical protein
MVDGGACTGDITFDRSDFFYVSNAQYDFYNLNHTLDLQKHRHRSNQPLLILILTALYQFDQKIRTPDQGHVQTLARNILQKMEKVRFDMEITCLIFSMMLTLRMNNTTPANVRESITSGHLRQRDCTSRSSRVQIHAISTNKAKRKRDSGFQLQRGGEVTLGSARGSIAQNEMAQRNKVNVLVERISKKGRKEVADE